MLQRDLSKSANRTDILSAADQRGHASFAPGGKPFANALTRAAKRDLVDQVIGHGCDGVVLLAGKVKVLDLLRCVFIAVAAREIIVKILTARAHPADVQGEVWFHLHSASVDVIADDNAHGWSDVEVGESLSVASAREAFLKRGAKDAHSMGRKKYRQPAVRDLRRKRDVLRPYRGNVDRDVGTQRVYDQLQRFAQAGSALHRYVVVFAVMLEWLLAPQDRSNNLDILARSSKQLSVDD